MSGVLEMGTRSRTVRVLPEIMLPVQDHSNSACAASTGVASPSKTMRFVALYFGCRSSIDTAGTGTLAIAIRTVAVSVLPPSATVSVISRSAGLADAKRVVKSQVAPVASGRVTPPKQAVGEAGVVTSLHAHCRVSHANVPSWSQTPWLHTSERHWKRKCLLNRDRWLQDTPEDHQGRSCCSHPVAAMHSGRP